MKKLLTILPLLFMACITTTEPTSAIITYSVELINGGMSQVYYIEPNGDMISVDCAAGDSLYQFEFEFNIGTSAGLGAYPDSNSVVAVIIKQDGVRVIAEYILVSEPTIWYWEVDCE